jgi:hypothetical protein
MLTRGQNEDPKGARDFRSNADVAKPEGARGHKKLQAGSQAANTGLSAES